jgi:hypothetical protein
MTLKPLRLILTPKDEAILLQFLKFRSLTAQEITHLCYSGWVGKTPKAKDSVPTGSLTYARSRLSALSGNQDITDKDLAYGYPLWRLGFPTGRRGNQERIWCLSAVGAEIIKRLGHPLPWYLNPAKLRTFSHSTWLHDLTRNRFVVSLLSWAKDSRPNLRLESRLSYEIAKQPPTVVIPVQRSILKEGKLVKIPVMTKVGVIPDGEIVVTNTSTRERHLLLLEIDHNTQAHERLRTHIMALLSYTKSSHFKRRYRDISYLIVYATQGVTDAASKSRLAYLCDFTMQLLTERKRQEDSQYFRFTAINFSTFYQDAQSLFEKSVWHTPDDLKLQSPIALFTDLKPQPQKEQAHAIH